MVRGPAGGMRTTRPVDHTADRPGRFLRQYRNRMVRMADEQREEPRTVLVVGPDGQPLGSVAVDEKRDDESDDPARLIEQPAKVMRIANMIKQLLEEVRAAPLDDAGRQRLKEIHRRSI